MNVALFVDTSVWSLAFRRDRTRLEPEVEALRRALTDGEHIATAGIVLLELLRGFLPVATEHTIASALRPLDFIEPRRSDYVAAADLSNTCRRKGVQLGTIDALIAAVCIAHDLRLLTTDRDFHHAAKHIPLRIWPA